MIISVDTNILIQASISNGKSRKMLEQICANNELVLSEVVLIEYKEVIKRNYILNRYEPINILENIKYKTIGIQKNIDYNLFNIRDRKDYLVLYCLLDKVDIFISNDKDFNDVTIEKPLIMTPLKFVKEFMH